MSGMEILEIDRNQLIVIERGGGAVELVIGSADLVVLEVAAQGLPGPPGTADFDTDVAFLYEIAKL